MATTCKACNICGIGMINIYSHPNNVDVMFNFTSGIKVKENDCLCIPCYDELKISYNFRQKCLQSELFRQTTLQENPSVADDIRLKETEITTTSIDEKIDDNEAAFNEQIDEISKYMVGEDISSTKLDDETVKHEVLPDIPEKDEDLMMEKINFIEDNNINETESDNENDNEDNMNASDETTVADENENESTVNKCNSPDEEKTEPSVNKSKKKRGRNVKHPEDDIFQTVHETQCEYCFAEFESINVKIEHEMLHKTEEKPYRCTFNVCTAQFKERYSLRNHARIHSDFKRYKCDYCDQRFHQRGNLLSHERLHTGEKPFLCPHCGKAFTESGNLKSHIRFHTGERPYACTECPKRFKTHYSHKVHLRSHTQERPYLCNECGKRFFSSGKLSIHKRIHSGFRPYKCTTCMAAFMDSSGLRRHLKIHN